MIKLIATDVDGTLVKDASPDIYPEIIEMVKELRRRDIIVCIASGRQYSSIEKLFKDVKDDLIFIADNGAHVKCRGKDLNIVNMNPEYLDELIKELRTFEDCEMICEGPGITYIESENPEFINFIETQYKCDYKQVDDVLTEGSNIIKASIFKRPSIRSIGDEILIPEWKDRLKVTMAGEDWVDFMDKSVDKGNALKFIQKFYGISPDETMVFGDNNNDIGMLKCATESYAVETAPDVVKDAANHICPSWKEKGVYQVLAANFSE